MKRNSCYHNNIYCTRFMNIDPFVTFFVFVSFCAAAAAVRLHIGQNKRKTLFLWHKTHNSVAIRNTI